MRVPDLDPPDDTLDAFGPESTARPEKLSSVDLPKGSGDQDPLGAFAAELAERPIAPQTPQPTTDVLRLELPEQPEPSRTIRTIRTLGTTRTRRTHRTTRTTRTIQNAVGLAVLALLAFATITGLNALRGRLARQPDAPALARAANQDGAAPPAAARPDTPGPAPVVAANGADATVVPKDALAAAAQSAVAAVKPVVALTKQEKPPAVSPPRDVQTQARATPARPATETARAPEPRVAAAPPSGSTVAQTVTPRVVDVAPPPAVPPAAVPAATTGASPAPSTTLSTTTSPAATPPATTPVVALANAPVTASAPAAVTPPAAVNTSAAPPAAARVVSQRAAVESVLGRYASAFSSLDAGSAKAVWPSVNERNLERAFDTLEEQEFDLGACEITVQPQQAMALCDGTARYTPKVGSRRMRTESRRWTFRLRQSGQNWAIESVESR